MTAPLRLSLVLPAHDEAGSLETLLPELRERLDAMEAGYEVVVVDDGSRDETPALLERYARTWRELKSIRLPVNRGQSEALAAGIAASRGSIVVTMDADGQSDPVDLPGFVEEFERNPGLDMIAGRRARRHDSLLRTIPSRVANALIRLVSGTRIADTGCGLKAFRGDLIRSVPFGPDMHRFLPVVLAMDGVTYEVKDVHHRPRIHGRPHYGLERLFGVILDIVALRFTSRRSRPFHTIGLAGLVFMLVSVVLCLYILYEKYWLGVWVHRNPLFLVAILVFLTGFQTLLMGLVIEVMAVMIGRQGGENRPSS